MVTDGLVVCWLCVFFLVRAAVFAFLCGCIVRSGGEEGVG